AAHRTIVGRVVVGGEQLAHQAVPVAAARLRFPFGYPGLAMERHERREALGEELRIVHEVLVVLAQEADPELGRCRDDDALGSPHALDQGAWHLALADLAALGFDEYRPGAVVAA